MGRNITKAIAAAVIAASIGMAGLTAPAQANGQFSFHLAPKDAEQERLMRAGLGIYALVNGIQNGSITQKGHGNSAGLAQGGWGNLGVVHQEGNGHNGTLQQHGHNNAYGLFQFGNGTNAHVNQYNDQTGLGFIFGW